jgi:hypothetical protein
MVSPQVADRDITRKIRIAVLFSRSQCRNRQPCSQLRNGIAVNPRADERRL